VPLATALCKTFLLRMLNDSSAGRNSSRVVVPIEEVEEEVENLWKRTSILHFMVEGKFFFQNILFFMLQNFCQ
jgi:hypothetical protein